MATTTCTLYGTLSIDKEDTGKQLDLYLQNIPDGAVNVVITAISSPYVLTKKADSVSSTSDWTVDISGTGITSGSASVSGTGSRYRTALTATSSISQTTEPIVWTVDNNGKKCTVDAYATATITYDQSYLATITTDGNGTATFESTGETSNYWLDGGYIKIVPTPNTGYVFDYMTVNGTTYTVDSFQMPAQTTSIVVYFTPTVVYYDSTLSYDAHGGSNAPASDTLSVTSLPTDHTVTSSTPTAPANSSQYSESITGGTRYYHYTYSFSSWNTDENGSGTSYSAGDTISVGSSQTLYAQWSSNKVIDSTVYDSYTNTLYYDATDGSNPPSSSSVTVTYPNTQSSHTVTSSTPTAPADSSQSSESITGGTRYYHYTYSFAGWYTAKSGGTKYSAGSTFKVGSTYTTYGQSDTLYAHWTSTKVIDSIVYNTYTNTLIYDANEGSGAPSNSSTTVTYPNTAWSTTVSSTVPTRTNYTFNGWSGSDGNTYSAGSSITVGSNNYLGNQSVTLTAQWTAIGTYTISYNGNAQSGGTVSNIPSSQTKYQGTSLTLSSTKPTHSNTTANGYSVSYNANGGSGTVPSTTYQTVTTTRAFKNWNTNSGGTGTSYSSGGTYTANASATLYAQWTSSSSVTFYNTVASGSGLSYDGYKFDGWRDSSGNTYAVGTSLTSQSSNLTLYAIWTAVTIVDTEYGDISITSFTVNDIPASGGTISSGAVEYSQDVTYTYSDGTTSTSTIISGGTLTYGTAVTASSLGTTEKTRTKVGTLSVTVSLNGKTASTSADVYQAANSLNSISVSLSPSKIVTEGTSTASCSAKFTSGTYDVTSSTTFSSGSTDIATVSGTTLTGVAAGTSVITGSYSSKTGTATLIVIEPSGYGYVRLTTDEVSGLAEDGWYEVQHAYSKVSGIWQEVNIISTLCSFENNKFCLKTPYNFTLDESGNVIYTRKAGDPRFTQVYSITTDGTGGIVTDIDWPNTGYPLIVSQGYISANSTSTDWADRYTFFSGGTNSQYDISAWITKGGSSWTSDIRPRLAFYKSSNSTGYTGSGGSFATGRYIVFGMTLSNAYYESNLSIDVFGSDYFNLDNPTKTSSANTLTNTSSCTLSSGKLIIFADGSDGSVAIMPSGNIFYGLDVYNDTSATTKLHELRPAISGTKVGICDNITNKFYEATGSWTYSES